MKRTVLTGRLSVPLITPLCLLLASPALCVEPALPGPTPSSAAAASTVSRPEAGTRIVGSDEAPAVLNIVPWQERELGAAPGQITTPAGSVLDEALNPVDRAELQREIEYLNVLQHRSPVTENKR
jgi:hypothetical protein